MGSKASKTLKTGEKAVGRFAARIGHHIAKSASAAAHTTANMLHKVDRTARSITAPITKTTGIDLYDFTPAGVVTSLGADVIDESGDGINLIDKAASGKKVSNRELNSLGSRVINSGVEYGVHRASGFLGGKVGGKLANKVTGKLSKKIAKSLGGKIASQKIGQGMTNNVKKN